MGRIRLQKENITNGETGSTHGRWLLFFTPDKRCCNKMWEQERRKEGRKPKETAAVFKPFLAEQVSVAGNSKVLNDTDASTATGNAELSCRGSVKHTKRCTLREQPGSFCQSLSIHCQEIDRERIRGGFVCIQVKKKGGGRESFYFTS